MAMNLGVKPSGKRVNNSVRPKRQRVGFWQWATSAIARLLVRWRMVWTLLLASLLLSGCVKYDVGVNFDNPNQGEIVQHIQLGDRTASSSGMTNQQWIDNIERRTKEVGGRVRRESSQDLTVTIPFTSGADLNEKFNAFFSGTAQKKAASNALIADLPDIKSQLQLDQGNLLLWVRNHLSYDLDLRSLGVTASDGSLIVSPGSLIDLEFRLNTPWGARSITTAPNAIAAQTQGKQLIWQLKPGQVNHLEAVFWLPSPLGIGTVVIVLLVVGGMTLKSRLSSPTAPTTTAE